MPVAHILKVSFEFGTKRLFLNIRIGHNKVKFIAATGTKRSNNQKSQLIIAGKLKEIWSRLKLLFANLLK